VRWGKEKCTTIFILVHSIIKLHPVYQDNLSLDSTIFKSFTNQTPRLHFWTTKHTRFLTHKNLDTQPTRITLADLKSHQANHPKAQVHPNLMVVVPSQPYMCSSSNLQATMPPRSTKIFKTRVVVVYCRERTLPKDEWHGFVQKKSDSHLCSQKHNLYSLV